MQYQHEDRISTNTNGKHIWDVGCYSCGKMDGDGVRFRKGINTPDNVSYWLCDCCHNGTSASKPDVWYGYGSGTHTEENICDPKTGNPIPFSSPRGKLEAMRKAGVVEAGDKFHGARSTFTNKRHS
jgi:hypothetical protein